MDMERKIPFIHKMNFSFKIHFKLNKWEESEVICFVGGVVVWQTKGEKNTVKQV